jgi:hypothetical protein
MPDVYVHETWYEHHDTGGYHTMNNTNMAVERNIDLGATLSINLVYYHLLLFTKLDQ